MIRWPGAPRPCVESQTNINTELQSRRARNHGTTGIFGDPLSRKGADVLRILLWNTNGIGFTTSDRSMESLKMEKLKRLLHDHAIDYAALTELNKNWSKVDTPNTIWSATAGWRQHRRLQVSYNKHFPTDTERLIGGTASMAMDDMVFRCGEQGNDSRGLGRWSYITLQGKNNLKTTIITCYCPVRSTTCPGSAYSQQLLYMSRNSAEIPENCQCPRQLFGIDLALFLEQRTQQGHQILLMGDFNSEYQHLKEWMLNNGLTDILYNRHGHGPRTCKRSKDSPIDCIFASPNLACKKGGFLSFSKLVSDHRGIWCDIPKALLFGFNPPPITHPNARRLIMEDPRVQEQYTTYVKEHLSRSDMRDMNLIHQVATYPLQSAYAKEYERLYAHSSKVMTAAEKQCRKLRMGKTPWSPTYKKMMLTFEFWCQREDYARGINKNVRDLIVLQNKLMITYDPNLTIPQIREKKLECYIQRRKCKNIAEQLSLEYRFRLAQARDDAGLGQAAAYIRSRNTIESQRRTFRNIRHIEQKIKGGATTHVTVTDENGSTRELNTKIPMEDAMLKENPRKYHQCEGSTSSQFLNQTFIDLFGHHGEGPATLEVLNGTFAPPPGTDEDTADFLEACSLKGAPPTQQSVAARYISMRKSWASRRERTVSNNHHMGHYKCLMKDADLSWFFYQRAEIPMYTGYSPKSHRNCVDLMILKKAGCYDLSKLRTLGLLDTEFNNNNRILSRETMHRALDTNCIAPEQFSRPGRSAIDQTILKRCTFDHHRSRRLCYSLCSSDLTGCYDRIVHTAAALALLRLGIRHSKIHSMFDSIQRMVHKVRTAFGDSEKTYGGDEMDDWENYPQGVLQGNANGPTIWAVLSSVVFEILQKRGFSNQFCSSISKQLFLLIGFSYVDDCDLFQSGTDRHEVLESMQELIDNWGGLMRVTGGALRTDKSWWYLIKFIWVRGQWVPTDAGDNLRLTAVNADGDRVELDYLSCDEASKLLGVWMAPNGNRIKLISVLKEAAVDWSAKFINSNASHLEAWTSVHSTISASIKYPLPASTLTEDECNSIMWPVIRAALPKAGIASNIATDARHGPLTSGGYGIISLYHYQGSYRTANLVEHCCRNTPTGKQIRHCIEDLALEAGYFGLLWHMPFPTYAKWTSSHSWVYSTCEYNYINSIHLNIEHACLHPKRVHDQPIMAEAAKHFDSSSDLAAINRVRMFHGVVSLADITTADGRRLNDEFLCSTEFDGRRNDYLWPVEDHVSSKDYTTWRKAMESIFPTENLHLLQPLGPCILDSDDEWLAHWDWFSTEDRQFLFRQVGETYWRRHVRKPGTQRTYHLEYLELDERPTMPLLRASVSSNQRAWLLLNHGAANYTLRPQTPTAFLGVIPYRPPKETWFMHNLQHSDSTDILWKHILAGTAITVSDGSFFPDEQVGACAWKVATPCMTQWIKAGGLVPGPLSAQSAYRSEVAGQAGIALFLSSLLLPCNATPIIKSACDGLSALNQIKTETDEVRQSSQHGDLLSITADAWAQSQFTLLKEHVRGHQDDVQRPLTVLETINCEMDFDAKLVATQYIHNGCPPTRFTPSTKGMGTITIRNQLVCSKIQQSLYQSVLHHNFVDRIAEKFGSDPITFDELTNWKAYKLARKSARFAIQKFISKWISGDVPTGSVMKQRGHRYDASCPVCQAPNEDLLHILTCPHPESKIFRNLQLEELQQWLQSEMTHPDISDFIISGLRSWFEDPEGYEPFHHFSTHALYDALQDQLQFSWFAALCGYISSSISSQQHQYFKSQQSRKSGNRWTIKLIHKLWTILHNIWKFRNDQLHQDSTISQLSGIDHLKTAIIQEHTLGRGNLPQVYASYFTTSIDALLNKTTTHLRQWFLVIRAGRECHDLNMTVDVFSTNPVLRTWVGLHALDTG